jgi:hypothetical protein
LPHDDLDEFGHEVGALVEHCGNVGPAVLETQLVRARQLTEARQPETGTVASAAPVVVDFLSLLDLRGAIPSFIHISDAKTQDVTVLDLLLPEPGAFYVMDRAYLDLDRLYTLDQAGSFFITRAKRGMSMRRVYSHPVDRTQGLICDQRIAFNNYRSLRDYPAQMRRIRYRDPLTNKSLVFLTNHTLLPAHSICALYKSRWQIELFFKWIKQHLRIKRFYGISENAVKTQLWIAVATYVLIAIIKKELQLSASLHTLLQILSVTLFEKIPLQQTLTDLPDATTDPSLPNQLILFDP